MEEIGARGGLGAILPSGYRLMRFDVSAQLGIFRHRLIAVPTLDPDREADYLLIPDDWPTA